MATVDLGKISFTQKGTWNSGTAYVSKDVVQYTDDNETSSYVAVASSTNQAPSTNGTVNTSYWALFAKGATVGSTNEGVWDVATAYQKNAVVQYTDSGTVSTFLAVADSTGEIPSTSGTVNSSYWQLIAKGTDSVGLAWQSTIVTGTTLSALAGNGYFIDTTSNVCTVTLPASASVGDTIEFADYARNWGTNKIILDTNSLNFQGSSSLNPEFSENGGHVRIVYSGATKGWIVTDDDGSDDQSLVTAQYLVVAGGGSGGAGEGGGGGAGGFLTGTSLKLTPGETYTVTVGAGGNGVPGAPKTAGNTGSNSSLTGTGITTIESFGGGGGGAASTTNGKSGGSGGGCSATPATSGGSGTLGQGFKGGDGTRTGGGGASEQGPDGTETPGGDGLQSSITGTATYYAGGGGGGHGGAPGGLGGGTTGVNNPSSSASSPANTGGGSGGANDASTGNGGSGVVILRVSTANYSGTTTGSPTVSVDGADTVIKFTGSGSYTA